MSAFAPNLTGARLAARRIAISHDGASRAVINAAAATLGWGSIEAHSGTMASAAAPIEWGTPPALLVVDLDGEADPLAALAVLAEHCLPETRVLAFGSADDVGLFRALLAAGVGDYLVKPLDPQVLSEAMQATAARTDDTGALCSATGQLVAVMGARGGCGASMLAASLAWTLASRRQQRTILVDLDLHFGSLAFGFGLQPRTGLAALLASPARIDERLIAAALQKAGDRLDIVAAMQPLEHEVAVAPQAVAALLAALRTTADWVVAELPRRLDASARETLRTAAQAVLVAPPSLEGLRDVSRLYTYVSALRAGARPLVVVNGAVDGGSEIGRAMFEDTLGARLAAWIPALPGPAAAAAAHALPLASLMGAGRRGSVFDALAERIAGAGMGFGAATKASRWTPAWLWRH